MNVKTQRRSIAGPSGAIECAVDSPAAPARALAVVCHPHPQHGGTMDNKVVQTLARAFVQLGFEVVRFNFRGGGLSQGAWAEGDGEVDDARAVVEAFRRPEWPLVLAGFSFGGFVASRVAADLAAATPAAACERQVLVAPAVSRFDTPVPSAGSLVVHGEADDVVPLAAVFDWARPRALPVTVIPGAGHFFHGQLPLLKSLVLAAWPH